MPDQTSELSSPRTPDTADTLASLGIVAQFDLNRNAGHPPFRLQVDIRLPGQGVTAIFGHSGSGKTTFLRCVAGLDQPDQAYLEINGQVWHNRHRCLPTHKRPLGYVFQEASLFPHLNAKRNLLYAIKRADQPFNPALYERVIEMLGIAPLLSRYPANLSGGERQRVAIARALLIQPRLLLMDEPLAALDMARKQEILPYLEKLRTAFEVPILYVSHSMDEVARLADYAVMLDQGHVSAKGNLTDVFSRIDLPGRYEDEVGVILQGEITERDSQWHLCKIAFNGGFFWVRDGGDNMGESVRLRVLARDISLSHNAHDDTSILNRLAAEVVEMQADNDEAMVLVRLKAGSNYLVARITRRSAAHLDIQPGKRLWAQVKSVAIVR